MVFLLILRLYETAYLPQLYPDKDCTEDGNIEGIIVRNGWRLFAQSPLRIDWEYTIGAISDFVAAHACPIGTRGLTVLL